MKRLALLAGVAAALVVPSPASANYHGPFEQDLQIAAAYWNVPAKCAPEGITIVFAALPSTEGGHAPLNGCNIRLWKKRGNRKMHTITISSDFFDHGGLSAEWWCDAITHEYGHLLGFEHSTDPSNVMYPSAPVGSVPGCVGV